ncbi:hypothetical protein JW899_02070, partial [Candidatus Uhrbacteria bacterium]|nr:hypothetical protein [Candidatus Uhrbacteria bacterium]
LPEEGRTAHVETALADDAWPVRREAIRALPSLPEAERLRLAPAAAKAVSAALFGGDPEDLKEAIRAFRSLPGADRALVAAEAPVSGSDAPPAGGDGLAAVAGRTRLYGGLEGRFFREGFAKTDSGTTLLDAVPTEPGMSLRDRVIVRHIGIRPFLEWERAFRAADFWRSKGFDYVPIEPIVGVGAGEGLTADVATRVVPGPTVAGWAAAAGFTHLDRIVDTQRRIMEGLEELGIEHGHPHEDNFVLAFDRDGEGRPDISRPPRVYAIDFDMAAPSGKP